MLVSFHTFGCKTNVYDSSIIANKLAANFEILENVLEADIHVVNTCTVTSSSDSQARNLINKIEKSNSGVFIIVTGCSVRNNDYKEFVSKLSNNEYLILDNFKTDVAEEILKFYNIKSLSKERLKFRTREFVKIGDGCNNFCSYCIIPFVRGSLKNRLISDIIEEVKIIEDTGTKEIVLTAISIDAYEYGLNNLIEAILKNTKEIRIRLSSLRPSSINESLIKLFLEPRLRPHFHISLQSGSNKILKLMNRFDYEASLFIETTNKISKILKTRRPFIGADLIVGFPGEEETEFLETINTLKNSYFTNLHIFKFSPRKKTEAYELNKLYKSVNLKERSRFLLDLATANYKKYLEAMIGHTTEVLWETTTKGYSENYFPVSGAGKKNTIEILKVIDVKGKNLIV